MIFSFEHLFALRGTSRNIMSEALAQQGEADPTTSLRGDPRPRPLPLLRAEQAGAGLYQLQLHAASAALPRQRRQATRSRNGDDYNGARQPNEVGLGQKGHEYWKLSRRGMAGLRDGVGLLRCGSAYLRQQGS
jgi:hypothetical protein